MKKVLAVDMDGVLADLIPRLIEVVNECEGDSVSHDDIITWNLGKYFKCGKKVYEYLTHDLFLTLPVIEDSQEAMRKLNEVYDLHIATSATNNKDSLVAKMTWLEEHFPFISYENIILCGKKDLISCDIMIEDSPMNLKAVQPRELGLLLDMPHNRKSKSHKRVMNWKEIEEILLRQCF